MYKDTGTETLMSIKCQQPVEHFARIRIHLLACWHEESPALLRRTENELRGGGKLEETSKPAMALTAHNTHPTKRWHVALQDDTVHA